MQTTTCPVCGQEIPAGSAFCPYCGIARQEQPTVEAPHWPTPQDDAPSTQFNPVPPKPQMPPIDPSTLYPPAVRGEMGVGMGWITFLRVLLWIFFGLMMAATVGATCAMIAEGYSDALLIGLGILVGGSFVSFLSVASGMIALNNASNHLKTASNTAKIVDLLQRKQ